MGVGAAVPLNKERIKMDIFWLFFMLSALQPIIKQKLLEASRKRLIALIERERKSRVVLLVHRQETMSLLGFPLFRYIDINDSEDVIRAIHLTDPEIPLDLVLHTPGGLVLAATQIARAIFKHKGKVTVFVPHYAMSGGTLLALAADRSEEHTSELQSQSNLVCRLLLEKKKRLNYSLQCNVRRYNSVITYI